MAQQKTVEEMFDELRKVCKEVRDDIKKRLVDDLDDSVMGGLRKMENGWLYEIISRIPDENLLNYLEYKLIKFDKERL